MHGLLTVGYFENSVNIKTANTRANKGAVIYARFKSPSGPTTSRNEDSILVDCLVIILNAYCVYTYGMHAFEQR